jgi:hypothetical protein
MSNKMELTARISLSFLWIFTGITSVFFAKDIGYEVLEQGGITGPLANFCILIGSSLDVLIGFWILLKWKMKFCYMLQLIVIVSYTLMLTTIEPSYWLHPFGPLTKNIPLLVMIYFLYNNSCIVQKIKFEQR